MKRKRLYNELEDTKPGALAKEELTKRLQKQRKILSDNGQS